jgi:Lon protease-like protein
MSFDATMKFSTNMNRAQIDTMLEECRSFAAAAQLTDVANELTGTAALPPAELGKCMTRCLEMLNAQDEYALLIDKLDMLLINVRNLK